MLREGVGLELVFENDRDHIPRCDESAFEQACEITGGSEDQLTGTMMQISQVVARQFNKQE